jgi:hypothetical protein
MKRVYLSFLFVFTVKLLFAQPGPPGIASNITVDFTKNTFTPVIPYDKPFNISGTVPKDVTSIELYIKEGYFPSAAPLEATYRKSRWTLSPNQTTFTLIVVAPLKANKHYSFEFVCYTNKAVTSDFRLPIITTTAIGDQVKWDIGLLYSPSPQAISGQVAAHLFLVPVNDDADIAALKGFKDNFLHRFSPYFGLSVLNFYSDTKQPMKNFVGIGNFVYGVSVHSPFYGCYLFSNNQIARKVLQPMYINFGELMFKQADANPLIVKDRNKSSFYVGLSYDFNFSSLFGPLTKLFVP